MKENNRNNMVFLFVAASVIVSSILLINDRRNKLPGNLTQYADSAAPTERMQTSEKSRYLPYYVRSKLNQWDVDIERANREESQEHFTHKNNMPASHGEGDEISSLDPDNVFKILYEFRGMEFPALEGAAQKVEQIHGYAPQFTYSSFDGAQVWPWFNESADNLESEEATFSDLRQLTRWYR